MRERFPPNVSAGRMENMANCRGLTHAGARAGEARRVPWGRRDGHAHAPGRGRGMLPQGMGGGTRGSSKAHIPPTGMAPELPPTFLEQLGKKGAFNLSVLTRGRGFCSFCKEQKPWARTPGMHHGSRLPANPSWLGPLWGLGGID